LETNAQPGEHLGAAELASLLESLRQLETPPDPAVAHPHFAVCSACRENFEELASLDRQLKNMRPAESDPPQGGCPGAEVWREIAAGPTPPEQTLVYIQHASRCERCGPMLRAAVSQFSDLIPEPTEEERKHIASLASASPDWQQKLAQRIAGAQIPPSLPDRELAPWWKKLPQWASIPRLAIAGTSLLAFIAWGSWFVIQHNQPAAAKRLLARAYTQERTLELRIAGADHAPLRVSRGPESSFANRASALLKAEALIASQINSHPSDPDWLQAKAQADVLEGKYDAAVESLSRALELEPNSPALLTDLATACFQRAQLEDKKEDLGAAYEYLSRALKLHPDDPVALFNRAIVSEHLFLYQQALDDWQHYLHVDPGSPWAKEAADHANTVRQKLKEHQGQASPLLSPAEIVARFSNTSPPSEVDQRIEEYLRQSVLSWLPEAFPEASANHTRPVADPSALRAIFFLTDLASKQHNDNWLADLLRGSSTPYFPRALAALARAVQADSSGEYGVARREGALAEHLFRASGNQAGVLRAQFEQTFTAQMTRQSEDCRQRATAELKASEKHSYPWLQIQLELEQSDCSGLMGDIGADEIGVRRAMDRAQQSGYGVVYLRALGFLAGDKRETGNAAEGWALVSAGLDRFWSGTFPAKRGYNLYTEFAHLAGDAARPHLEMAFWREATSLTESDGNLLVRGMAHRSMADAAAAADVPDVAKQHYAEAARLFAAAPTTEASRNDFLENEVSTARLDVRLDQPDSAIARLASIQDRVHGLSNNYLLQIFYSTLGELQLRRHRGAEAEQALRPALALAERSLATLKSEAERTNWSSNAAPAYLALTEAELMQGRPQEALETYEWFLSAPQRVSTDPNSPRPASPLPHLLAKETVIAYAALPGGLAIWVYDDRGLNAVWTPKPTDDLQELAERFHGLSSDRHSEISACRRDARSLYDALIAPVEQHLDRGRTLVIETEGWLARVPFEALLDSNDHYLIERAPIVHSLGRDSQARLRDATAISSNLPALVVGSTASSPAEGLIPLPDVAAEANSVASGFHPARVLTGGEATLSAVREDLPGTAVFHFAGHSLAAPGGMGLMLEGKNEPGQTNIRLMDAAVVRQLHLQNLQLAVLSACNTASGGGSSGVDSVTDAFLRAGVPHVVASRWAVDSAETQVFVQDFYRHALSGQSVSDAIRLTSQNIMANPHTSHPYYWSAFAAYGRP
jgi:CHAT domain-containing protein/tetratricopeptide (TPR) repeat protein